MIVPREGEGHTHILGWVGKQHCKATHSSSLPLVLIAASITHPVMITADMSTLSFLLMTTLSPLWALRQCTLIYCPGVCGFVCVCVFWAQLNDAFGLGWKEVERNVFALWAD